MTSARGKVWAMGAFRAPSPVAPPLLAFPKQIFLEHCLTALAWGTWSATIQRHAFLGDAQEPRPRLELLRQPAACSFDGDLRFAHLADPQGPPARKPAGSRTQTPR